MKEENRIESLKNLYQSERWIYESLSWKITSIIEEILKDKWITIHWIYQRTKTLESFEKKIENEKYTDINMITDLSGIRIITYVENDLDIISTIIKDTFTIDEQNCINLNEELWTDKVWYKSIHYVAMLPDDRINLPEYHKFKWLKFEIQIRTILQHSWAEIEHDRNYKFSGKLPIALERRFKILAGVLELADKEFNAIAYEIDEYSKEVSHEVETKWNLDIQIDSTSLKAFLDIKYEQYRKKWLIGDFYSKKIENEIINELKKFDITTLDQLDYIIPKELDLIDQKEISYAWLLRYIMIIKDAEKYFNNCWNKDRRNWINEKFVKALEKHIKDIRKIILKYNINIIT